MPGNIVVKPIEANLTRNTSAIGKMSPYYVVALGDSRQKGAVCKKGGKSPIWTDAVTVERTGDPFCVVELKTKRALLPDKTIGTCKIMVEEISEQKSSRWYDIFYKDKVAGKILIEANLMAGEAELVSQHGIQPLAAQSANALLEEREREGEAPVQENRNAVSLGDLPNKRDGYEVRVIEPAEHHDVMQEPVMDPSLDPARASVEQVEHQGEEKKTNALEELKETVHEVGHEVKEAVVQPRDSVAADDYEVPEERTQEEGVYGMVKPEHVPRQRL